MDPVKLLRGYILLALAGLLILPFLSDLTLGAMRADPGSGCRIVTVVDGDTVRLWCPRDGVVRARLTGFDTPELFSPQCGREHAAAIAATLALRLRLWQAETALFRFEGSDRYGRKLVAVRLDGVPLADVMIRDGHARPYRGGTRGGWCD